MQINMGALDLAICDVPPASVNQVIQDTHSSGIEVARRIQDMLIDVTAGVRHLRGLPPGEFAKRLFEGLAPIICVASEYAEERVADWPVPPLTDKSSS